MCMQPLNWYIFERPLRNDDWNRNRDSITIGRFADLEVGPMALYPGVQLMWDFKELLIRGLGRVVSRQTLISWILQII